MLRSAHVLVTGASGFIGSHLTEALLTEGAKVTCLIHYNSNSRLGNLELLPPERLQEVRIVSGNIEDGDFVQRIVEGQDIILNLAALIAIPYPMPPLGAMSAQTLKAH